MTAYLSMETKLQFSFLYVAGKFYGFTVYMVCANSIVNPFVYVIQYHEFQNRTKEIFCEKQKQLTEGSTSTTVATDVNLSADVK